MKLIVGLGNPGPQYAETRHNVGWRVAEVVAARLGAGPWREKFQAAVAEARAGRQKVVLARPMTFMNLSGQAVRPMMDFWKVESGDLLVVSDDLAMEAGRLRLRGEGSAGGHHGLESILLHLGHEQFARLRVGIGPRMALATEGQRRGFGLANSAEAKEISQRDARTALKQSLAERQAQMMGTFGRIAPVDVGTLFV